MLFVNRMAGMVRGGGETFDLEISKELARSGCRVSFLTGQPVCSSPAKKTGLGGHDDSGGHAPTAIDFHFIRSPYLPWFPWDKVRGGWRVRVWEFRQFERKAARWIAEHANDYDIIQICELPYLVSLLKTPTSKVKTKISIRLTAPNAHDPWGGIKMADAVIASGTSIERVRGTLRHDVCDIPNGVDLSRFRPLGESGPDEQRNARLFREDHGISPGDPVLLYVARYQAFKNHAMLMDAFSLVLKSIPSAWLVLAGSGPLMPEIRGRARESTFQGRVVMLGETPFERLPSVYSAADIKVISSEYESFCFAAIESMAAGLPVVTTDCGWVPTLLGDKLPPIEKQWVDGGDVPGRFGKEGDGNRIRHAPGGLVVGRADAFSMAKAIEMMMNDAGLRNQCGRWNRERAVREHGWENSARKLLDVYGALLVGNHAVVTDK